MLVRSAIAMWLALLSPVYAVEDVCSTTQEAGEELFGFPFVDDVKGEVVDKWFTTSSRMFDFDGNGVVYMKKLAGQDDEAQKRWKAYYAVQTRSEGNMLCFPSSLDISQTPYCAFLAKSADINMSFAGKLVFPCEVDGRQGFEIVGVTISNRGEIFGQPHPSGKNMIREGDFQRAPKAKAPETSEVAAAKAAVPAGYTSVDFIDAKLDLPKLVNKKIVVEGNLSIVMDSGSLSDPNQETDFNPIGVDLDALPREDRKYALQNCQTSCLVKVAGGVTKNELDEYVISAFEIFR